MRGEGDHLRYGRIDGAYPHFNGQGLPTDEAPQQLGNPLTTDRVSPYAEGFGDHLTTDEHAAVEELAADIRVVLDVERGLADILRRAGRQTSSDAVKPEDKI
jgi:hypothetical protein